jgi:hypothetical protein
MLLLHLDYILTQIVLPGDLVALWEMINLLVLIQAFVEVTLAPRVAPQDIPVV